MVTEQRVRYSCTAASVCFPHNGPTWYRLNARFTCGPITAWLTLSPPLAATVWRLVSSAQRLTRSWADGRHLMLASRPSSIAQLAVAGRCNAVGVSPRLGVPNQCRCSSVTHTRSSPSEGLSHSPVSASVWSHLGCLSLTSLVLRVMPLPPAPFGCWEYDLVAMRPGHRSDVDGEKVCLPLPDGGQQLLTFTTADAAQRFRRELEEASWELLLFARPDWVGGRFERAELAGIFGLPGSASYNFRDVDPPAVVRPDILPYVHDGREVDVLRIRSVTPVDVSHLRVHLTGGEVVTLTYSSAEEMSTGREQVLRRMWEALRALSRLGRPRQRLWRPSQPWTIVSVV